MNDGFQQLLVTGATWLVLAALAWAAAIAVALVLEVASAGRVRATWACPPSLRRSLLAGLGLLLSGGAIGLPAAAAPRPAPLPAGAATLPVPARPLGAAPPVAHPRWHVVRRGDTLWGLAAEELAPAARAPDVARLVQRLHARNRAVIGPDPDHLEPGQRLRLAPRPDREDRP